jgi:hypothetical protein
VKSKNKVGDAMMRILLVICLMMGTSWAQEVEISEDGWLVGAPSAEPGSPPLVTDDVPLPSTPDYILHLRMQVGGLAFGDFDNDGDLDLAAGCYHSQSFPPYPDWRDFVLVNNNGELEAAPSWWSSDDESTTDVKWADFDTNGYLDLFAARGDASYDPNAVYFGSASGLATSPGWLGTDVTYTTGCDVSDFDHDGDIDVATSNQAMAPNPTRPVYIYENTGAGLNPTPTWQSADLAISGFVKWGDMNNDGWEELAVSKWVAYNSCVYPNNQGTMGTTPIWTNSSSRSEKGIGWGDVDNDSFPELAIGATEPTWLFDNVAGQIGANPTWQSSNSYHGCQDLGWADIDHDGDPDLATVEFSNGQIRIYLNVDGTLESAPSWMYDCPEMGTALAFGDVNGDTLLDLAMGISGDTCIMVFLNTLGSVGAEEPIAPGAFSLAQNYPNPFNAATMIDFEIKNRSHVNIEIFDLLGNKVDTPLDRYLAAGSYSVNWNASAVSSGTYFYRLTSDGESFTRKMALVK